MEFVMTSDLKYGATRSQEMIDGYFYSITTTEYIMFDKSCAPYLRAKFALIKNKKIILPSSHHNKYVSNNRTI